MENTSEKKDKNSVKKPLKHICIGLVAHVDAGKTTLSEGMLYLSGQIRNMGRVDHGDTFLDNYETERERGITIFSKQAEFIWNDTSITILDTPGHVDFSAEMERVLQVLDCAVLVVSAVDGVQAHTVTLWRLLKQYKIPTMIFVNKMDRQEADREKLLEELKNRFGDGCVEMDMQSEENRESLAMCDETMLEEYLSGGKIEKETVKKAVAARKVFPCWFGSALKAQGIEALMSGLCEYAPSAEPLPEFGAKVYQADEIAKELQKIGQTCYREMVRYFGKEILALDGEIDRPKLAGIVFKEEEKLLRLNQMVHPAVREYLLSEIERQKEEHTAYFIIEAALLLENDYRAICDEIWYIHTSEDVRRQRLKESRGYDDRKISEIIASQLPESEFYAKCDAVVENDGDFEETRRQIGELLA